MTLSEFNSLALALPKVSDEPHLSKAAYKILKNIFVTLDPKLTTATFRLLEKNQDILSLIAKKHIYPIPNKWGKMGWTFFEIKHLGKETIQEVLKVVYCELAPKELQKLVNND